MARRTPASDLLPRPRPEISPGRGRRRRSRALAQVACLALLVAGCAGQRNRAAERAKVAEKHYEIAVGSFHSGLFEDAKIQLRQALDADPDHAPSHYLQGVLLLNQGKSILDALETEQCLTDEAARLQRERAMELHRQAYEAFKKAAGEFGPDDPGLGRAYNSMAVVSLRVHQVDRAITEARKALESKFYNERYSALANLGWAFYFKGDYVQAMTELRQAVLLNPDYCVGHYRLAQVYMDSDLPDKAWEAVQMVLGNERCPIQDAHRLAGVASMRIGLADEAGQALQSCIALAPRSCLASDCEQLLRSGGSKVASAQAPAP